MARQRSHNIAFKRQVAQEFIAGETLYGLSKRHDISRQLMATESRPLYNQTEGGGAEAAFAECSQTRATEIRHESQRRDA